MAGRDARSVYWPRRSRDLIWKLIGPLRRQTKGKRCSDPCTKVVRASSTFLLVNQRLCDKQGELNNPWAQHSLLVRRGTNRWRWYLNSSVYVIIFHLWGFVLFCTWQFLFYIVCMCIIHIFNYSAWYSVTILEVPKGWTSSWLKIRTF